jgi:RNA polymerase sigma-70 factor (ECF subfamily)
VYAQNADRVYRLLLRMTGNADDAFELSQDVFVGVFSKLDRFDARSSLSTWVYQIALNEGRQFLRRKKLHQAKLTEMNRPSETSDTPAADIRLDIAEALDRLPEEERTLLVLRYFEQLSYDEIAEAIDKPAGTVASGLNRARKLLREQLSPEDARRP